MRWLSRKTSQATTAPAARRDLTDAQVRAWRAFVSECNAALAAADPSAGIEIYAQKIREAVIKRRITVEDFLEVHPAPWRR